MKLLLVLAVGIMAAVPLLAPSPAQALTACASVTTTLAPTDSCTIDDGGTTYEISLQTGTFQSLFPSPSTTSPGFWWGDAEKAIATAQSVYTAFGLDTAFAGLYGLEMGPWVAFTPSKFATFENLKQQRPVVGELVIYEGAPLAGTSWATSSLYAPSAGASSVPGPLPVLGVAAAFVFSRKLRKRFKRSTNSAAGTLGA